MKLYQKILYPTDFSENSIQTMNYALKVSKTHGAELILLYSYRLINNGNSDHVSHRNSLAEKGRRNYEVVHEQLLDGSDVNYTYLSEIGFVEDRILATVLENDVDLVIMCENIRDTIEKHTHNGKNRLMNRLNCPLMFVPADLS